MALTIPKNQRFNPRTKDIRQWLEDYEDESEKIQKMPVNRKSAAARQITSKRGHYDGQ